MANDLARSATQAPARRQDDVVQTVKRKLEDAREQLQAVLPQHLRAERVIQGVVAAIWREPKLRACDPESIIKAVSLACQIGLDPSGVAGQGWLVPFGSQAQFIPGYKGLIELARRSGAVKRVEARIVYEHDTFEVRYGTDAGIRHLPASLGENRGRMVGAYALAIFSDGSVQFEVMSTAEIDAIRKRSKAGNSGPWVTDYEQMARKTPVRRLMNYLPSSPELAQALEADDQQYEPVAVRETTEIRPDDLRALAAPVEEPAPEPDPVAPPEDAFFSDVEAENERALLEAEIEDLARRLGEEKIPVRGYLSKLAPSTSIDELRTVRDAMATRAKALARKR